MNNTITWKKTNEKRYDSSDGETIKREYGKTPNGNKLFGCWVYRDKNGEFIDYDGFRNDLFERWDIKITQ